MCIGIVAGTFVLESKYDYSSFSNSTFYIITSVGCPLIHPSTLTVVVNFLEFSEYNARAAPVNSNEREFFNKSIKDIQ